MKWVRLREAEYEARFGRWVVTVYCVPHDGNRWHVSFRCSGFDLPGTYLQLDDAKRIAQRIADTELWTGLRELHHPD